MTNKKILCIAADGFEDLELVAIIDVLHRVKVTVVLAGLESATLHGAYGTTLQGDTVLANAPGTIESYVREYDGIVVPGGKKNALALSQSLAVIELFKRFDAEGKMVAAICAAPSHVLVGTGIVRGRKMSGDPIFNDRLLAAGAIVTGLPVTTDANMITGTGPGTALAFGLALAEYLGEGEQATTLRHKWGVQ